MAERKEKSVFMAQDVNAKKRRGFSGMARAYGQDSGGIAAAARSAPPGKDCHCKGEARSNLSVFKPRRHYSTELNTQKLDKVLTINDNPPLGNDIFEHYKKRAEKVNNPFRPPDPHHSGRGRRVIGYP
jgi:hypothetical protein